MSDTVSALPARFLPMQATQKQLEKILELRKQVLEACSNEKSCGIVNDKVFSVLKTKDKNSCSLCIQWLRSLTPASSKQREAICAICLELRTFYTFQQWQSIREYIVCKMTNLSMSKADSLIKGIKRYIDAKKNGGCQKVCIPERYILNDKNFRTNIRQVGVMIFRVKSNSW